MSAPEPLSPVEFCRLLLRTLEASDGRRRRRKRNTTPDAIGLGMKRQLLERATEEAPTADAFEGWLLGVTLGGDGGARAMARDIHDEWQMARREPAFRAWLERGAPSDDVGGEGAP
ncbi:hypothetical protein [Chondromyces crocatus]|uniref:Uncharacterized protein n=1 Tax=Chondromyces crocatus TaxID=52 RepID=A0A0K1ELJ3_CHOCO|nr:hypothetical protein [Chondromyces crocatus]AKT41750.1 uncharacterized protein CMC5_059610 [Chondromyces crocatus]